MYRTYFLRMAELARTGLYDVCAHFDIVKRCGVRAPEDLIAAIVPPALDAVAAAGMAIEINTSGFDHGAAEAYPSLQILAWMKDRADSDHLRLRLPQSRPNRPALRGSHRPGPRRGLCAPRRLPPPQKTLVPF